MNRYDFISWTPIVDLDKWPQTEEYPTGSREKVTLIDPGTGRHYIFKLPKERREHQIWSELLASFIAGDLLGWEVQRASIAQRKGRLGNLLEFVYEPREMNAVQETFTEGEKLCKQVDPEFDVEKGTRHTLPLLERVCDDVLVCEFGMARKDIMEFWARTLAFDSLISNTDRHAENWAIITGQSGSRMAPLYDNGSSLGCGFDEVGLNRAFDKNGEVKPAHINKMRKKGRHHVRIQSACSRGSKFEELCTAFLARFPEGRQWFEEAGEVEIDAVSDVMASIRKETSLSDPHQLSKRRQAHIYAMLQMGTERLKNTLRQSRFDD